MNKISLIICDDHAFTRSGLQHWLDNEPRFDVIASAATGVETMRLVRKEKPQIALVDYNLPDANGLEITIELSRWMPECKVAILTSREDATIVDPLLRAGAKALLSKSSPPEELCAALLDVAAGNQVIAPIFQQALEAQQEAVALTPREIEVLIRLAKGMANPAIAEDMSLAVKTIETHRASLMRKLQVNSATSLIVKAAKLGLIDL